MQDKSVETSALIASALWSTPIGFIRIFIILFHLFRFFHETHFFFSYSRCASFSFFLYLILGWNLIGHSDSEGNPNTLSQTRVTDVLLVASPYELFLMEDDCLFFSQFAK